MCAGKHFGTVVEDVARTPYFVGDTVRVTFQSACPRNNVRTGDTFLQVQKLQEETGRWITVSVLTLDVKQRVAMKRHSTLVWALSLSQYSNCCAHWGHLRSSAEAAGKPETLDNSKHTLKCQSQHCFRVTLDNTGSVCRKLCLDLEHRDARGDRTLGHCKRALFVIAEFFHSICCCVRSKHLTNRVMELKELTRPCITARTLSITVLP